LAQG